METLYAIQENLGKIYDFVERDDTISVLAINAVSPSGLVAYVKGKENTVQVMSVEALLTYLKNNGVSNISSDWLFSATAEETDTHEPSSYDIVKMLFRQESLLFHAVDLRDGLADLNIIYVCEVVEVLCIEEHKRVRETAQLYEGILFNIFLVTGGRVKRKTITAVELHRLSTTHILTNVYDVKPRLGDAFKDKEYVYNTYIASEYRKKITFEQKEMFLNQ